MYIYIKVCNVSVAINTLHNIRDQTCQELRQKALNTVMFESTSGASSSNYNTVHYGKLLLIKL